MARLVEWPTANWFNQVTEPLGTSEPPRLLNPGCGSHYHPAWINLDVRAGRGVQAHDLYQPLPFKDNLFDAVYHSHLLEHLSKRYAPLFMQECYRVLKPGGIVRVAVPDLEAIAHNYLSYLDELQEIQDALQFDGFTGDETQFDFEDEYDWATIELLDQMTRHRPGGEMFNYWQRVPQRATEFIEYRIGKVPRPSKPYLPDGEPLAEETDAERVGRFRLSGEAHLWMYDSFSLGRVLRNAGFQDVKQCHADESSIPCFNSYLLDINPDGSVRKPDSLFMEGRK